MSLKVTEPVPKDRPGNPVAAKQLDNGILIPLADPLDELAQHVNGTLVVVVRTSGNRVRRRCWLSVASAERHARRAQVAGRSAEIYLAELKPIWRLSGWSA